MGDMYSAAQLTKYLKYIALPRNYEPYIADPSSFPKTEDALTTLFRGQITRFPYDNLTVHYSVDNTVDISPQGIYTKLMGHGDTSPSGRGGYCLECSIFFHHVLRGLGFTVYMTGVRNRERIDGIPQGEFKGWTHIVNIVTLPPGQEYHVDAAFGGDGPTRPLPLISGYTIQNLGTQEVRLIRGTMAKQTRPENKVWIYQYRNDPTKDWNSFYCFTDIEFFQDDFEVMNRFTSWDALQKGNRWVVKFIRGGEAEGLAVLEGESVDRFEEGVVVAGKVMFVNDVIKLNLGGRTRVVDSFKTEQERMDGLRRWFAMSI
ncbi:hypothetical protein N7492_009909 [Penicillium capsulatum]|uniref:Arylamine N-acetyltransferase n=1 Tax=Penicillium capsulatum TaxID=69766 RepID=A0A9W9LEG5_9EURO|nr:hypothetical protein N7492_009909 [Penicillium capsulatum]KAJ6112420.1 hypothetical protein N7512_007744 [Penicillium capsulatum]